MTCRRVSWGEKISLATDNLQKGVCVCVLGGGGGGVGYR